jgi:STE24 endopeptidase
LQALYFVGLLALGQGILSIPFSAYSTFQIEAEYGFNRTTVGTFLGDLVKGAMVGAIIGGLLFAFIVQMLGHYGEHAWLAIWIGYTAFQFFLVWIAPVALLPLFLKLTPMKEGPLLSAIESYSQKQSFKLDGVWVCDASKRSAKSNAFFTGFGRFRRLVLFDTLIEKHPPEEIVAVVAHEAGHFKLGHIWKTSVLSAFSSLIFFFVVQKLTEMGSLYTAFEMNSANIGIGLVLAILVLSKILFFVSPLRAYISRRNEFAADRFSVQTTGDAASLVRGLKRLVTENLATLQHHPLYVILHDSHPPLPDRLKPLSTQ